MNKKKTKINIILIIVVIFLIVTALMIRFEFNPISYILGNNNDKPTNKEVVTNFNGVYRYKESLNKTYKLYHNCTLSYYDFYIVILNDNYYRYKSTCVGTFLLDEGKTKDLKFGENLEKSTVITFDGNEYLKTDYIDSVVEGNYLKNNLEDTGRIYADTYHVLLKEAQLKGKEFDILDVSLNFSNVNLVFKFKKLAPRSFDIKLFGADEKVIYSYNVKTMNDLPLFLGFGQNLSIIEPIVNDIRYAYTFKSITKAGLNYNLESKFPITIDGDLLTYSDNIYIKYSPSENVFVLLVSDSKKFCEKDSDSNEVAYYVFHIKYDYVEKNFTNPKFIRKVYKKEGCKYVDDLMEG